MLFLLNNFLYQLLGTITVIAGILYVYFKYVAYNYWKSKGIAQSEVFGPFGSLWPTLSGEKSIGELMRDEYLQYRKNRVFGVYSFHRPSLVICDPGVIRFVLTKEFSRFRDRGIYCNEDVDPMSGHLFLRSGIRWKNLRVKLTPTFTSGKMRHMFAAVKECSDNLVQCVEEAVKDSNLVEVRDLMARFSTDVIASVAFGIDCNSLRNPEAEFRKWGRKVLEPKPVMNALMVLYPPILKLFNIGTTDKGASDFFIKVFKETVNFRRANNVVRRDFLELVMQLMDKGYVDEDDDCETVPAAESTVERITMLEGAAQAFVFWLAGFESSSSTMTYCLYELALNQDVQYKLIHEIDTVLADIEAVTYESLTEMPYLHKVVCETLRKYPSLPFLNRECTQDTDLPDTGIFIAQGTPIIIPVWGLHWNPDIYAEPEKFDPERFNEKNVANRHNYAYLPFGEGPRNCIGMRFGLLQTKIGLISLLSKYRIERAPDTEVPLQMDKGTLLNCPRDGIMLRLEER